MVKCICKKCGVSFEVKNSDKKRGRGKFCSLPCHYKFGRSKESNKKTSNTIHRTKCYPYKNEQTINDGGYRLIRCPEHPHANGREYVREQRLVMEKHLGRFLTKKEIIHHKGIKYPLGSLENKQDNRINNLEIMTASEHTKYHIDLYHLNLKRNPIKN